MRTISEKNLDPVNVPATSHEAAEAAIRLSREEDAGWDATGSPVDFQTEDAALSEQPIPHCESAEPKAWRGSRRR